MGRVATVLVAALLAAGAVAADNTPPEGFTALFNGKDLTGWGTRDGKPATEQQAAQWRVEDGIIKYTGKDGDLWTTKAYKDFVLMVEWKMDKPADSGIYVRGTPKCQANIWPNELGSGEVYGYRTDKNMPEEVRKAATPSKKADKPLGEWNAFVITVKGERMTVELNKEKVIDNLEMVKCPAEGPIALQNHGQPLDFRNIYIKELKD
ncbi:MAG: DUF1080 domain-containing protein [Planctomycetes bacterium]|nr:DUF1080 domain-containing protein [Planctomycetota bacterium]